MNITVENWRNVHHISAEGAGVTAAAGQWSRYCTDPYDFSEREQKKAIVVAETLRKALAKAEAKLKPDAKLEAKRDTLKRTNSTDARKKAELAALEKRVENDAAKVKATRDLIEEWDAQAAKYVRSVMKSRERTKHLLDMHKSQLEDALAHFKTISDLAEVGRKGVESAVKYIEDRVMEGEKLLAITFRARESNDSRKLKIAGRKADELRKLAEEENHKASDDAEKILDHIRKLFEATDPQLKDSLTDPKLAERLRKGSDHADQEITGLEFSLHALEGPMARLGEILDKVERAMTEGLDEATEIEESLERGIERLAQQLENAEALVERGIGAYIEQAGLEIINLSEGGDASPQARAKVRQNALDSLAQAAKNMRNGDAMLRRLQAHYVETVKLIPERFEKHGSHAQELVDKIRSWKDDLKKYAATQSENKRKLKQLAAKLETLAKLPENAEV